MASGFDKLEQGQNAKVQHDSEMQFRIEARRNKLLGLWAAECMGIEGEAADAYAIDVVKEDIKEPGHQDVVDKIKSDFAAKGVDIDEDTICRKLSHYEAAAVEQMQAE